MAVSVPHTEEGWLVGWLRRRRRPPVAPAQTADSPVPREPEALAHSERRELARRQADQIVDRIAPIYSITWLAIALWDFAYGGVGAVNAPALAALLCGAMVLVLRRRRRTLDGRLAHWEIFAISTASLAACAVRLSLPGGAAPDGVALMAAFCPAFFAYTATGLCATLSIAALAWAAYLWAHPTLEDWAVSAAAFAFFWAVASARLTALATVRNEQVDRVLRAWNAKRDEGDVSGQVLNARGEMDGVWEWDIRNDSFYFSPRWRSLLGYGSEAPAQTSEDWFNLIHPYDLEELMRRLTAHMDGKLDGFECEHRIRQQDGSYRWVLSRGQIVRNARGEPDRMPGSQIDIKRMKDYENRLIHSATHDQLTGLPNRQVLLEELTKQVQMRERNPHYQFALAFVDLDGFKLINDTLGHQAGDELLVEVARRIRATVREGDLVARVGGDEFVVVMPDSGPPRCAAEVAERIQSAAKRSVRLNGRDVAMAASIGIAMPGARTASVDDLMRNADLAMYQAKRNGKARTEFFDAALSEQASRKFETQNRLREALENDELELYYQPIVSLADCRVTAVEALIRWRRRGAILAPAEFIPIAEESDLIVEIGKRALESACLQARRWRTRLGGAPVLSVNVSARQLRRPDFAEQVSAALRDSELEPRSLQLEVTESALGDDPEGVALRLEELSRLGVRLAIDDFGTGYSALAYLRTLRCHTLKMDRSFISEIAVDAKLQAIAGSIVQMAGGLGLSVVAEGVETRAQLETLRDLGCGQIQGYLITPPADAETVTALLDSPQAIEDRLQIGLQAPLRFA